MSGLHPVYRALPLPWMPKHSNQCVIVHAIPFLSPAKLSLLFFCFIFRLFVRPFYCSPLGSCLTWFQGYMNVNGGNRFYSIVILKNGLKTVRPDCLSPGQTYVATALRPLRDWQFPAIAEVATRSPIGPSEVAEKSATSRGPRCDQISRS